MGKDIGIDCIADQVILLNAIKNIKKPIISDNDDIKYPNTMNPDSSKWSGYDDKKEGWMSVETTIHEINLSKQYFKLEGWFAIFWRDTNFDKDQQLKSFKIETK